MSIFVYKNSRSIGVNGALCPIRLERYQNIDPDINDTIQLACEACLRPLNTCNGVDADRTYTRADASGDFVFALPPEFAAAEPIFTAERDLEYDHPCVWTNTVSASGGGVSIQSRNDLTITENADGTVTMSLLITVTLSGLVDAVKTIVYSAYDISPDDLGPITMTTTDDRVWDLGGGNTVTFPITFTITADH